MKLIVGLGNPGEKYESTRHNLGFTILDHFLKDAQPVDKTTWENSIKFKSQIYILDWKPKQGSLQKIILAKPTTYMNKSGMAVSLLSTYYKVLPQDIWIVHDELDLPLGNMKIRLGGSAAGHHGLESILVALGTDKFWRFRVGIGKDNPKYKSRPTGKLRPRDAKLRNVEDFVLDRFNAHEAGTLKHMIKRGSQALVVALEKDMHSAMNRFNTK